MRALNNWKLSKKMLLAFALLGVLLAALSFNSIRSNRALGAIAGKHVTQDIAGLSALADVLTEIREQRIIVYSYYNALTPKDEASLEERMAKSTDDLTRYVDNFAGVAHPSLTGQIARLRREASTLADVNARIFAARKSGDLPATLALVKTAGKAASHDTIDAAETLLKGTRDLADRADAEGRAYERQAMILAALLAAVSAAVLAAVWWAIESTVSRPMASLADATSALAAGRGADVPYRGRGDELGAIAVAVEQFRVAAAERAEADAAVAAEQRAVTARLGEGLSALTSGDLAHDIAGDFPPAYAGLKANFNTALAGLRDLIGAVSESAAAIRTGSGEIAQASEDLARRTESNAASLEETAASVTQMDARLRASAAAAGRTVDRADQAIATVGTGRAVAGQAVEAMDRVSDSAKGIDSVIEGLDKIAFQTRVLAMNAAVEAGRAGEAGRGFAVVADLVSALAMRAEEEAKRARDQLTVTQSEIVTAVEAVQRVDGALADISGDVGQVHELLATMATDNQAQSAAITQISAAIGTMDQATQQNAAMVEETSAAARNLASEVTQLVGKAAQFRTGREGRREAHAATVAQLQAPPPRRLATAGADGWNAF